jgi:hypothetical protein
MGLPDISISFNTMFVYVASGFCRPKEQLVLQIECFNQIVAVTCLSFAVWTEGAQKRPGCKPFAFRNMDYVSVFHGGSLNSGILTSGRLAKIKRTSSLK